MCYELTSIFTVGVFHISEEQACVKVINSCFFFFFLALSDGNILRLEFLFPSFGNIIHGLRMTVSV